MQPSFTSPATSRLPRRLLVAAILVVLGLAGFMAYRALTFHIVTTDPSLSRVGSYSPFLKIYFNEALDPSKTRVSSDDNIIKNTSVSGKILTITFNQRLTVGQRYSVNLDNVSDLKNQTITNKKLRFTAKDIPISSLSADQQKTLISRQDKYPYTVYTIPFNNFDALTNNGLTSDQEQVVKQAIYDYSVSVNQKFKNVSLDTSSIYPGPFDPNSTDPSRNLTFSINADGTKYNVSVTYSDLTTAHVVITDVVGTTVFDNTAH